MKSQFDLTGKVVVVTGGAGLLGFAFAKKLVLSGAKVVIAEKDIEAARVAVKNLTNEKPSIYCFPCELDITNSTSIKFAVTSIHSHYGKIDVLINNAYPRNKNYGKEFIDVSYEDFCENVGMNLGGYFQTSKFFAEYFVKQGYGNIINVASVYGVIAPKFEVYQNTEMTMPVEYAAIKSGLIHLTKYMAKYFKGKKIRVNTISPGGILDDQNEDFIDAYNNLCLSKGMLDREDVTGALLFLISDASKFINGQNIIVDDGFSI
jgi:NAD(P)-dependent dehydrogenase (short-subunit alcohol dehydrogenase family)